MDIIAKLITYLIVAPALTVILAIAGIIATVMICRAASCIIDEHERKYGKIKWKWFIFIKKTANNEMIKEP